MKWFGRTIFSLALMAMAGSAMALEPLGSDRSISSSRRGFMRPATLEQTAAVQPERIGSETPVHFRQATWNIWGGYHGYVYSPDSCDYTPPCVDHLWDGYSQYYHRCEGFHWGGRWGCHGCGRGGHCGLFGHRCGHFGHRGCGCGDKVGCDSCVAKAPVCGVEMKPSCGAEPSCGCGGHGWHLGHHWNGLCHKGRHFWHRTKAHWSCACGTDVGCGCGIETKGGGDYAPVPALPPDAGAPPAPMPEVDDQRASHIEVREAKPIKLPAIGSGLKSYFQR